MTELIEMVNCHTYTVELLAQHMENSGQTVDEMIDALREQGILSIHEKVTDEKMKMQVAYENLLKMFSLFALSDDERNVLLYLSMMPLSGVNAREFRNWVGLTGNNELRSLERKSWIVKNTEGIALHPIIRDVVRHEIPATVSACVPFIRRFSDAISEGTMWHARKVEKDRYAQITRGVLQAFPEINEYTLKLYQNAEGMYSFAVDPAYAEVLAERIWDYAVKVYSEQSYEAGHAAYKRGWLYAYNSQLPNSVEQACRWLSRAEEILSTVSLDTEERKGAYAQVLTNLSKMHLVRYEQTGDLAEYDAAIVAGKRSIAHCASGFTPDQVQYTKLAGAHWQLADALCAGEEYERALHHINIALDILIERHTENDSDSMFALYRRACIYFGMGEYASAEAGLEKSTCGYVEFFGRAHPNVYRMYRMWGDCCVKMNKMEKAEEVYRKALEAAQLIFAPESEPIVAVRKCIDELKK